MAELYHAKKKKGLKDSVNGLLNEVEGVGKHTRAIKDKIQGSTAYNSYNKKKTANEFFNVPDGAETKKKSSGILSGVNKVKGTVSNSARLINATTEGAKKSMIRNKNAQEQEPEENPPKNLRRRLNHVRLAQIVGPKKPTHH